MEKYINILLVLFLVFTFIQPFADSAGHKGEKL
jgi:hypothetical protein